ncbi:hypothetical protein ACFWN2_30290 [Lentzea sp. NPDC058436]|uniref:hypothetical protein n=1 Tax=Lentzea sp. NPDC058436 TaxID=3346499 RepID=UPI0036577539
MRQWLPPDPDDRAYFLARMRRERVLAWAGIAFGVPLLAILGPVAWVRFEDAEATIADLPYSWPIWGAMVAVLVVGGGVHHLLTTEKPPDE